MIVVVMMIAAMMRVVLFDGDDDSGDDESCGYDGMGVNMHPSKRSTWRSTSTMCSLKAHTFLYEISFSLLFLVFTPECQPQLEY